MKSVLITGHCGFIGHHLVKTFLQLDGVKVIGYDIKHGQDIRGRDRLPEADWCFHLAALTDARSEDAEAIMKTNVIGTLQVLKQFKSRVVFASSSAVNYPVTPYAISKLTGEQLCFSYGARVVRLCNIYGEGGHGVVDKFREQEILEINGRGDQIRTYAPVKEAVKALIEAPTREEGSLDILVGEDKTVLQLAKSMDKPVRFLPAILTDILDGRQICP